MKCYHSAAVGPDKAAIQIALRKAYSINTDTCIALPELRLLDGVLGEILGERAVKFLKKDHKAQYFGKPLRITTPKIDAGVLYGAIIAAYVDMAQLDALAAKYPKQTFIYLAPDDEALAAYLAKHASMAI